MKNTKNTSYNIHFVTAVLKTIGTFYSKRANFSKHDITVAIRNATKNSEFGILDVEYDFFDDNFLPVIRHDDVKEVVKELFTENFIPNYKETFFDGLPYVIYEYQNADDNSNSVTSAALVDSASVQGYDSPVQAIQDFKTEEMWEKAETYVKNMKAVTSKMIQSRLKGYPVTCQQIVNYFTTNGYEVEYEFGNGPSTATILSK